MLSMKTAPSAAGALLLVLALASACPAGERWHTYTDCRLVENPANDGDSFHVRAGRRTYCFRLYFVDCPETAATFPERVAEQAAYWGVSEQAALRLGREAEAFTRDFLKEGFTVHTKREDARGHADNKRYFAVVETRSGSLADALVANGLARIYGADTELPDGSEARSCWKHLRQVEIKARREKRGAWGLPAEKKK